MKAKDKAIGLIKEFSTVKKAVKVVEEVILNSLTIGEMLRKNRDLSKKKIYYYIDDSAVKYWEAVREELLKIKK